MVYYAQIEPKTDIGVLKKISGVVDSANRLNISSRVDIVDDLSYRGILCLFKKIINSKENIIMLRSCGIYMFILIPAFLWLRVFTNKKLIIDIPTPVSIFILESRSRPRPLYKMFFFEFLIRVSFPFSLWFAHKVIQYGQESEVFSIGVKSKIEVMSNGVDVSKLTSRTTFPLLNDQIVFVSVANVANWHGYDRLIRGVFDYNKTSSGNLKAKFILIGDGGELNSLKKLVDSLDLKNFVEFVGVKVGSDLQRYYEMAHIAVASLALHRKNIDIASELKAREYTSVGIPFLMTAKDYDFDRDVNFIYHLSSSEEPIDISAIVHWYRELHFNHQEILKMRDYALKYLDFSAKIRQILSFKG
ncbi:MAG: glycosyltransferase [Agitococcus sp.]|nr:glycosyltransferase [Agitococcus sp.]